MRVLRKVVFWLHLIVGVSVAVVVVIMSVTGVLLTYQRQLTYWMDTRGLDAGPPRAGMGRLSADSLLASTARATKATPTALTLRRAANAPAEVALGRDRRVFVNVYTGAVLGSGSRATRDFFRVTTAWHRTLGATGERRAMGRAITGAANLGFLFIVVTGLYLWWPRTWTRARLRNIALFRRTASGKARDFNWHNTVGSWSFVPLFVVVLSGTVISYPWASALVYRLVGERPPASGQSQPASPPPASGRGGVIALEPAITIAAARMSDWRTISLQVPAAAAQTVAFTIDAGTGGQPQRRAQLSLDARTGAEVKWEPFSSQTPGRRLRSVLRFAHTGEVLGLFGQTIAGLVSLGAVLLAYTGIALTVRRFAAFRARRGRALAQSA